MTWSRFAGAKWVESMFKVTCSPLGAQVDEILGSVFRGIYHVEYKQLQQVDWTSEQRISLKIGGPLSTYDFDSLRRRLVSEFDCGEFMESVDISACKPQMLEHYLYLPHFVKYGYVHSSPHEYYDRSRPARYVSCDPGLY